MKIGVSAKFKEIILFIIVILSFYTSGVPYDSTITSATLSFYGKAKHVGPGGEDDVEAIGIPAQVTSLSPIRADDKVHYEMNLPAGWSMISLPVAPNIASVYSLFPDAVIIYGYKNGIGYVRIKKEEELEIGMGYWILLNEEHSYTLIGQLIQEYNFPVPNEGWYMIGGCSSPAKVSVDKGTICVIYGYVQQLGYKRISESERLDPGKGYWICLSDISNLTVRIIYPTTEWTFHKTPDDIHPDGNEQQMVWLMNRARSNPSEEGIWLATTNNPDIAFGRSYFNVDVNVLENEFAGYSAKPPAAFDVRLYYAAREHSEDLINRDAQDHYHQFDRITGQVFSFTNVRGNVFSYGKNALNAHGSLNIDWSFGYTDGMLPGRAHRKAIMSIDGEYTNVGIAMVGDKDPNTQVGPWVITGNYCKASVNAEDHYNRFLVGTVWNDANGDSIYDPGEGIAGVTVMPGHGEYYAITSNSGGYAIPVTSQGTYLITFSGPSLNGRIFKTVEIGSESFLLDLIDN